MLTFASEIVGLERNCNSTQQSFAWSFWEIWTNLWSYFFFCLEVNIYPLGISFNTYWSSSCTSTVI